jgi:divalent metal cation (Fe/Co/Zn/Cd) transporter
MNKRMNTLLFVLGATLFNIIVTVASFLLLLAAYQNLLGNRLPPDAQVHTWSFLLVFIAAIVISFVAYRLTINQLLKKIDMDRYFDPIFTGRRR